MCDSTSVWMSSHKTALGVLWVVRAALSSPRTSVFPSGPLLTSTLHPNNWRSPGRGFSMVCVSVCVYHERRHTHTHTRTYLHPAACHCYFTLAASLRKEAQGDCVCFSKGVFSRVCVWVSECVCVHAMTQCKFNIGAFLCSCHPDTRLRSVGI